MLKTKVILIIFIFGLVSILSGVASGRSEKDLEKAFQQAEEALKKNDSEKTLAILKPLSDKGIFRATFTLGMMYQTLDSKNSLEFLKLAYEQLTEEEKTTMGNDVLKTIAIVEKQINDEKNSKKVLDLIK